MYKEYNIWDENLDLDEWVPDATTAALVYRIAAATGRTDIYITGYKDTEGEEFDRLSVNELRDLVVAEQTAR